MDAATRAIVGVAATGMVAVQEWLRARTGRDAGKAAVEILEWMVGQPEVQRELAADPKTTAMVRRILARTVRPGSARGV